MSHSIPGLHCAGRLRVSILITSIIFAIIKISKRLASISKGEYDIGIHFFPRGHGNEFGDLIGSLRGPDFPISAHGHANAYVSFSPFVYKAI